MAVMTARERIWAAVNHQEPDRVPLDIGGGSSTGIVVEGYERLKHYLGVKSETKELNKIFRVARTDEVVLQRLGSDCRPLALNPDFVTALMSKLLEINKAVTGRFLDAVGSFIHVFRTADDLATQQRPLMSPQTYRTLLKPYYKEYFDLVKSRTEAKIFYHSCGNVTDLIDDLVEIGVEILNPVQVSAMGDTAELKAKFGEKVTFWGAIDTQHVLPHGTIEEVEAEVRQRIHDLAPGGGFVVGPVHNIQPDVPPENIIAVAEATHKYGSYPLAA